MSRAAHRDEPSRADQGKGIPAVLLAAGQSSRLGSPKQMIRIGEETLLERGARIASEAGADPVFVVLGAHIDQIRSLSFPENAVFVINDQWEEGVASSIRHGVQAVVELGREVEGVLLLVCDQPSMSVSHLCALFSEARRTDGAINTVASSYAGVTGTPAVFPANRFRQLLALCGDQGARPLLRDPAYPLHLVPLQHGEIDIDTIDDLSKWQQL